MSAWSLKLPEDRVTAATLQELSLSHTGTHKRKQEQTDAVANKTQLRSFEPQFIASPYL